MENQKLANQNNPQKPGSEQPAEDMSKERIQENVFDDDLSDGKNSLGENPEQILYTQPSTVEDASQILSDGNEK